MRVTTPAATCRMSWVEVDPVAIEQNTRLMRLHVGPDVGVIGVVKADGYGHGAVLAAKAMIAGGAIGLAAATIGEGQRLRGAGIDAPILVLGYTPPEQVADALQYNLALAISDPETLHTAAALGQATGRALKLHLKIDTGMHRLGLLPHEALPFLEANYATHGVTWQGIYTHLAVADEPLASRRRPNRSRVSRMSWHPYILQATNSHLFMRPTAPAHLATPKRATTPFGRALRSTASHITKRRDCRTGFNRRWRSTPGLFALLRCRRAVRCRMAQRM
ncbi:MAG: hypothetical protein HC828_21365 [Blastochloris sp.]|nr:hypothetical protein [Blastochloris sp.]